MKVILYQVYPFIKDHYLLHAKLIQCTITIPLLVGHVSNLHNESITISIYILLIAQGPQQGRVLAEKESPKPFRH